MSDQPQQNRRMIGHDALRIALDHERGTYQTAVTRAVWRQQDHEAGRYTPPTDEERIIALERYRKASEFADWAMAEFRRTYDTGGTS